MKLTGAQILMKMFKGRRCGYHFRVSRRCVLDIYDELMDTDIKHILVRHEQGAVHAADGYARVTGKVGVCLVTSGPGATNTVTGIAIRLHGFDSRGDFHGPGTDPPHRQRRIPGSGYRRHHPPCTKHNYLVKDVRELAQNRQGSLSHCPFRTARAGARRYSQRYYPTAPRPSRCRMKPELRILQSHVQTQHPNSCRKSWTDQGEKTGHLFRRRRQPVQGP
jgi:hypothetical protein